jgi:hypothetical protein
LNKIDLPLARITSICELMSSKEGAKRKATNNPWEVIDLTDDAGSTDEVVHLTFVENGREVTNLVKLIIKNMSD